MFYTEPTTHSTDELCSCRACFNSSREDHDEHEEPQHEPWEKRYAKDVGQSAYDPI